MLNVEDLVVRFSRYRGLLRRETLTVLDRVSLEVHPGEVVALIGASGAGKSLLAHAVLGILPRNAHVNGRIHFESAALTPQRQRHLRGKRIALVPQAITYLDPSARSARQVSWAAQAAGRGDSHALGAAELTRLQLDSNAHRHFPHQLSGGMARRVLTAIATVSQADLLIADEPTTGLDPEASRLALGYLRTLADQGKGVIVITHDIAAIQPVADRIAVLHAGQTVEMFPVNAFSAGQVKHPYTQMLRSALPQHGFEAPAQVHAGTTMQAHAGCSFCAACSLASARCQSETPPWHGESGHRVRCHHV